MTDAKAAANLRTAFDLFTAGVRLQRQNLRRRHPEASEQEINACASFTRSPTGSSRISASWFLLMAKTYHDRE